MRTAIPDLGIGLMRSLRNAGVKLRPLADRELFLVTKKSVALIKRTIGADSFIESRSRGVIRLDPVIPGARLPPQMPGLGENEDDYDFSRYARATRDLLSPYVGAVTLEFPSEQVVEPARGGPFRILFYCSAADFGWADGPEKIFGFDYENEDGDEPLATSHAGKLIRDGSLRVAQLVGNTLYILVKLDFPGDKNHLGIFSAILKKCVPLVADRVAALEKERAENATPSKGAQGRYVKLCARCFEPEAGQTQERAQLEQRLQALRREIVIVARRLEELRMAAAEAGKPRDWAAEFQRLYKLAHVRAVAVDESEDRVVVVTDTVDCRDPGSKRLYRLGEFEIAIPFNPGDDIKIRNLTNSVDRHPHPHVDQNGSPCWNLDEIMALHLGRCDIPTVMSLIIQFLETYNPSGPFVDLSDWPEAPVERKTHARS